MPDNKNRTPTKKRQTKKSSSSSGTRTFDSVFADVDAPVAQAAGRLRRIVLSAVAHAEENVAGGSKVQLVLYSVGGPNRVVCGIQPGGSRCLFYLHRIEQEDIPEYKLTGRGKHSKRIDIADESEIVEEAIRRAVELSSSRLPPVESKQS